MSQNKPDNSRLRAVAALTGAGWMMAEDRIKQLIATAKDVAKRAGPADDECDSDPSVAAEFHVKQGVATIPIIGILTKYPSWLDEYCGLIPSTCLLAALDKAMGDWTVRSVNLLIDSPGGMVAGTSEFAEAIAAYRLSHPNKPIYATVSDLAASGGYYLASQCRSISCNAMGEVGCIGVYCVLVDESKFWEEMGVTFAVVSSGGVKGLGADGKVSQELIDDQKRGIMGMYEKFIADVATGRGMSIEQARKLGDGRTWLANESINLGLIDSIASVGDATAAIIQETYSMTSEQVKAFAAEHPDDTAVKDIRVAGHNAGKAEGVSQERIRVSGILEAHGLAEHPASTSVKAGHDAETAKLVASVAAKAKADADAQATANTAALAAKDAEIKRLQFAAEGQKSVNTNGASGEGSAPTTGSQDDPEAQAKAEWKSNKDECQSTFASEDIYVRARKRELTRAA